jgi:hypothetical protein
MLSEEQSELVFRKCQESTIDTLWEIFNPSHNLWTGFDRLGFDKFLNRRDIFLWALARLLRDGRIKLHKNGIFLKSSIEDQVELFKKSWPESEEASGYEDFYWWFFDPECPAGIAWRKQDGSYEIAD